VAEAYGPRPLQESRQEDVMRDKHTSFIKTPKQLVIVVALAFAIPIALIVLLSQLVTGVRSPGRDAETGVLNRIKPVGEVTMADATAPQASMTGEQVYQDVCKVCHEAGLVGAPKLGDKAAWAPRIKRGINALYASAINGKDQMPPKGGNRNLSDIDVQRGVVYMANRSGAKFNEPPAAPTAATASAPAAPVATTAPVAAITAAAAPSAAAGAARPGAPLDLKAAEALMQKDGCAACHGIDKKIVGPAYVEVAAKYKSDAGAQAKLTQKVKAGGAGVWGQIPMPPNPQVPDDDIKALVSWILALKK
jgi:cytochrome c5